ncbi:MAG: phage Gp37/Gp68 family protein [Desulfovibrionaceae bacterium]|nr:phage Gp37/Gp68 family protein [Desulfovibrionaceae bacterium]
MAKSKIEYIDESWNNASGCNHESPGCDNCYAKRQAHRNMLMGQAKYSYGFKLTLHEQCLNYPLTIKKPSMIFVNSMSDTFHKGIPLAYIERIFDVMTLCPQHTFLLLTKRAQRLAEVALDLPWPKHIWAGVTVEDAPRMFRLDYLRKVPAAVRFVSFEPLLTPLPGLDLTGINWAIAGGETGPGARAMDLDWARGIRDVSITSGVPFFFKNRGGFRRPVDGNMLDGRTWTEIPVRE